MTMYSQGTAGIRFQLVATTASLQFHTQTADIAVHEAPTDYLYHGRWFYSVKQQTMNQIMLQIRT